LGMPAGGGHVLVDEELRARVRSALHHEERLTPLQLALRERGLLRHVFLELYRVEADGRVILKGTATVGAVVSVLWVSMSTVPTDHPRPPVHPALAGRSRLPRCCEPYKRVRVRSTLGRAC